MMQQSPNKRTLWYIRNIKRLYVMKEKKRENAVTATATFKKKELPKNYKKRDF